MTPEERELLLLMATIKGRELAGLRPSEKQVMRMMELIGYVRKAAELKLPGK